MQHFTQDELYILKTVSDIIKEQRISHNKSQRLLADEYDLQKSMISRLENGKNEPLLFSIWKISYALGLKPSELLRLVEERLAKDITLLDI